MKKTDCKKLKDLSYDDFKRMDYDYANEILMKVLPEKERFKSRSLGDFDWWYCSKHIDVDENQQMKHLCIIRSWNKYKQKWIYKCIDSLELLYCLHLDNEYDL